MQATYPMNLEALDVAVKEFSRRIAERDRRATVETRYGFQPDEVLIIVRSTGGNDGYSLNLMTGEWYRYVILA